MNGMTPTAPVARVTALFQDMFKNDNMSKKVEETNSTEGTLSIKLSAKGVGNAQYKAYEYQPVDNNMQNVALLEKVEKNLVQTQEM